VTDYLDLDDVVALAREFLGDPPPIRDLGLLASAVGRPAATALGIDAYPDLWTKAAALMQSLVVNHPRLDGNKRLGWIGAVTFLGINGVPVADVDVDAAETLVLDIATGRARDVDAIADRLRPLLEAK
jgi:death-on-curing protein